MSEVSDDSAGDSPVSAYAPEATAPGIPSLASGSRLRAAEPSDQAPAPISVRSTASEQKLAVRAAGERLGNYQLVSEIARGGMAKIYLAVRIGSEGFRRVVTIKRLHRALLREQNYVDMFIDEAMLSSLVQHPFVREVYDLGYENGAYYMAMEFLNGEPLSAVYEALLGASPAPRPARHAAIVARVVADLAAGVHAIHCIENSAGERLDVIHRDVSPQNLFVLHDGSCRVTDLGIAHAKGRRQTTVGRRLKGKLAYMSPEYLSQQECDQRTDVWSLGVVLWELLIGKRLFRRESEAKIVQAVLNDPIATPSSVDRAIDPALDRIVGRALQREPELRHASALELVQELESYLAKNFPLVSRADVSAWLDRLLPESRRNLIELERGARTVALIPSQARSSRPALESQPALPSATVQVGVAVALLVLFLACWVLLR
jgi:serine/threonine-protein kinase